jgi:hypothetical protein
MRMSLLRTRAATRILTMCLMLVAATAALYSAPQDGERLLPPKIKVGEKAPEFQLLSSKEKPVRLSDYSGHNILIDLYRGYW